MLALGHTYFTCGDMDFTFEDMVGLDMLGITCGDIVGLDMLDFTVGTGWILHVGKCLTSHVGAC